MSDCGGCGHTFDNGPGRTHCHLCPPWPCENCGQTNSMADPCACWVDITGMALADQKGMLARAGLSIQLPS